MLRIISLNALIIVIIDRIIYLDDLISRDNDQSLVELRKVLNEFGLRAALLWLSQRGHFILLPRCKHDAILYYPCTDNALEASSRSIIETQVRQSVDEVEAGLIPSHPKLLLLGSRLLEYCKNAATVLHINALQGFLRLTNST